MIYDRTYSDIVKARQIYTEKVQKFIALTGEETSIMDRAYFNLSAINRITGKLLEIWDFIGDIGGTVVLNNDIREWADNEFFKVNNFQGIIDNIKEAAATITHFGIGTSEIEDAVGKITTNYDYVNLNTIEKLLFDIEQALDDFQFSFAYQIDDVLYIIGAHGVKQSGGNLNIE